MRSGLVLMCIACTLGVRAQNSTPSNSSPSSAQTPSSKSAQDSKPLTPRNPNLTPPRSDRVNADTLEDAEGQSSSKDTLIDLSPPPGDDKAHPESSDLLVDETAAPGSGNVAEFHTWNPHKAAKDIEVGNFYFKRKNYRAAADRYREALYYKDNDAEATYHLAVCLDKLDQPDDAGKAYESYLKILPHGPQAEEAQKAIDRLKGAAANVKAAP